MLATALDKDAENLSVPRELPRGAVHNAAVMDLELRECVLHKHVRDAFELSLDRDIERREWLWARNPERSCCLSMGFGLSSKCRRQFTTRTHITRIYRDGMCCAAPLEFTPVARTRRERVEKGSLSNRDSTRIDQ